MPQFAKASLEKLSTCHSDLQRLFNEVIKHYDCSVLEGARAGERQQQLFKEGKSKLGAGKSKHNHDPSLAADVIPYPLTDWNDKAKFYHFIGYVKATADQLRIKIRCGGDWDGDNDLKDQTFYDLPHFELTDK